MVEFGKLIGIKVFGAKAYNLGEVNGADVDTMKWQVTHLHVKLTDEATRELGFKKPLLGSVTICLPVSLVEAVGDVITLSKGIRDIKDEVEHKKHS